MGTQDLPVAVTLDEPLGRQVRGHVESELGWQVVPVGGPPEPALVIAAAPTGERSVVVVDGVPDDEALRAALRDGALDVLGWPHDRDRLPAAAERAGALAPVAAPPTLRVAGAAGGVGASTVALAAAGLLAWSGHRVVAVGDDGLCRLAGLGPWQGPGSAEVAALEPADAAREVAALALPVPGVDGLTVLGGGAVHDAPGWQVDAVVVDGGAAASADLLVAAPDARLAAAADVAAPVLLCGEGPVDAAAARRLLGREPLGRLPRSARVARAALAGQVPAGLPGSWLARLGAALAELEARG